MSKLELNETRVLELLADLEHEQWCHLIKYLWSVNYLKKLGLPMERYIQLVKTPYSRLREHEKDSDREWARKVLKIIAKWLVQHRHPLYPFEGQEGYTKEEWNMREIARQTQICHLNHEFIKSLRDKGLGKDLRKLADKAGKIKKNE